MLFRDQILENGDSPGDEEFPILQEPTEVIHAKLREVDPVMADRWHPKDRRKIQRSLEICLKTGKRASQIYAEKFQSKDGSERDKVSSGGDLRFSTLILWPHAQREALVQRLDSRVLSMVQNGLLDEVETLDSLLRSKEASGGTVDRTYGIWISIGYKEFEEYQNALHCGKIPPEDLAKLKKLGIERTQGATRRYAKYQVRWIRIKLINALQRANALQNTYLLDGSDISKWNETVARPATEITSAFLEGKPMPNPLSLSDAAREMLNPESDDLSQHPDKWLMHTCEACGTIAVTPQNWHMHVRSRRHRMAMAKQLKAQA